MLLEKPTSWQLIIKSSALFVWILGGIFSLVLSFLLISIVMEGPLRQEIMFANLILAGLFVYCLASFRLPTINVMFDLQEGTFTLKKKWVWKEQVVKYPLKKIKNICVVRKGQVGKARRYYKIKVELFSGELIPISAMNYRAETYLKTIQVELKEFLKQADFLSLNS